MPTSKERYNRGLGAQSKRVDKAISKLLKMAKAKNKK